MFQKTGIRVEKATILWLQSAIIQANYNNKQKVKWDNKLELKLGSKLLRETLSIVLRPQKTLFATQVNSVYKQVRSGITPYNSLLVLSS